MNFEDEILGLLEQSPDARFSARQIGRMLDRELFREDPNWARPSLELLVMQRRIECDNAGCWFQAKESARRAMPAALAA